MVRSMKPGAIIIDLPAEQGRKVELAKAREYEIVAVRRRQDRRACSSAASLPVDASSL